MPYYVFETLPYFIFYQNQCEILIPLKSLGDFALSSVKLRIYSRITELTGGLYAIVYLTCHENLIPISL